MKLIYFHGFASSGASGTVELLRKMLPSAEVIAPDIPVDPLEALPFLTDLVEREQPDIVLGTSMGGMYAAQMHGHLRICVNPANAYATFTKYYTHAQRYDGGHQLNDSALKHAVMPLMRTLLGQRFEAALQPPLPDYMRYATHGE